MLYVPPSLLPPFWILIKFIVMKDELYTPDSQETLAEQTVRTQAVLEQVRPSSTFSDFSDPSLPPRSSPSTPIPSSPSPRTVGRSKPS